MTPVLLLLVPLSLPGETPGLLNLTGEEKAWLAKNSSKLVAAHMTRSTSEGLQEIHSYCTIGEEYLVEIEKNLGITFKTRSYNDLYSILEDTKKGTIDIIPTIEKEKGTESYLNFTPPYFDSPAVIITRKTSAPFNLNTLEKSKVSVSGSYRMFNAMRKRFPKAAILPEDILHDGLEMLSGGIHDAVIAAKLPASYALKQNKFRNLEIKTATDYHCRLHLATLSSNTTLATILKKSLAAIPVKTRKEIIERWKKKSGLNSPETTSWYYFLLAAAVVLSLLWWGGSIVIRKYLPAGKIPFSRPLIIAVTAVFIFFILVLTGLIFNQKFNLPGDSSTLQLTAEEKTWLAAHSNAFTVDAGYNIPPIAFFSGKNYTGIAVDYLELISKKTGISIRPVLVKDYSDTLKKTKEGKINIIGGMQKTSERSKFFYFTEPYFSSPVIILTRGTDSPAVTLEDLKNKKVAIPEKSFLIAHIKKSHPHIKICEENSYLDALLKVSFGKCDAAIMNQTVAFFLIERETIPNLAVSGKTQFINQFSFAVPRQHPMLFSILSRSFNAISKKERDAINQRWFYTGARPAVNSNELIRLFLITATIIIIIILIFLAWNFSLHQRVRSQTRRLEEELEKRKRITRELSNSRSEYRHIFRGSPVGIFFYDPGLKILRFNDRFAKLLKAPPEKLKFLNMNDLKDNSIKPALKKAASGTEGIYEGPYHTTNSDIIIFIRMKTAPIISSNGEVIGAVGIVEDITDRMKVREKINDQNEQLKNLNRKMETANEDLLAANEELEAMNNQLIKSHEEVMESEILYRNIFEGVADGLIIFDREYKISAANEAAMNMLGYNRSEILDLSVAAVMDTEVHELSSLMDTRMRNTGKFLETIQQFRRDGTTFPAEVKGSIIRFHGKEHILAVIRDISERLKTEELILQSEKMHTVGSLAAGMAHEINNPLGIIIQGIQNVERRLMTDIPANREEASALNLEFNDIQQYCEKRGISRYFTGIREAGERAADIIKRLINFSTRGESQRTKVNINNLLQETLDLAAKDYDLKKKYNFGKIKIDYKLKENIPPVLLIREDIEQVILHLVRNSAQFMVDKKYGDHELGPALIIETDFDDKILSLRISDTGPGISRDILPKIFDPFYTTRKVGSGTGLGLTVAYFIITGRHNGSISIESTSPEGTTILIEIPVQG